MLVVGGSLKKEAARSTSRARTTRSPRTRQRRWKCRTRRSAEADSLSIASITTERTRLSFFFFQAQDGIRYLIVTGVQTCALPISLRHDHAIHGTVRFQQDLAFGKV